MARLKTLELDLISWIREQEQDFPASVLRKIGDDCATFNPSFASSLAITTDLMVENIHFRRNWVHPFLLGRKALLTNLSDLAAAGAQPYGCLLTLALPAELARGYFYPFMKGILAESRRWKTPLLGGDLSNSAQIMINLTVWGYIDEGEAVYRSTARGEDYLILVGEVGLSRLGLRMLEKENPVGLSELSSEGALAKWAGNPFRYRCLKAHLLPEPPLEVGVWLRKKGLVNAMIDISDGLASDLLHIARESHLTALLELDKIELPMEVQDRSLARSAVLDGGEDYALLFTSSSSQMDRIQASYPLHFPPYKVIGRLVEGQPAIALIHEGKRLPYEPQGFDHFR